MDYDFLQISLNVEMCQKCSQSIYGALELANDQALGKVLGEQQFR